MDAFETRVDELKSDFLAEVTGFSPELRCAAEALLRRIGASNWTLEWGLPFWLGTTFGLADDAIREMMLCNVFGLGFVRLVDDLADAESPWPDMTCVNAGTARVGNIRETESGHPGKDPGRQPPTPGDGVLLQVALHHLFGRKIRRTADRIRRQPAGNGGAHKGELHARFFLNSCDSCMRRWLQATSERALHPGTSFRLYTDRDFALLAERGAPLEICCAAACALAGRPRALRFVARIIDDLLVACVLLDHVYDWALDLKAGRYNTFVAYCSDLAQSEPNSESNREAVLKTLFAGDGGRPYLGCIHKYLDKASNGAASLRCDGLVEFIRILGEETSAYWSHLMFEVAKTMGMLKR